MWEGRRGTFLRRYSRLVLAQGQASRPVYQIGDPKQACVEFENLMLVRACDEISLKKREPDP